MVIASHNVHKVAELAALLQDMPFEFVSLHDWPSGQSFSPPEETGNTFLENALIKARHACALTGLPALADDSGLVVPGLGGAPGVMSARYAGQQASDHDNNQKLLQTLAEQGEVSRHAFFVCVLVLLQHEHDPLPLIAEGRLSGKIIETPRGNGGFGYDPLVYLPEQDCTVAELSAAEKNQLSHRGHAAKELMRMFMNDIHRQ